MKYSIRCLLPGLLLLLFISFFSPLNLQAAAGPQVQLKSSIDKVMLVLRDKTLKGDENRQLRREKIEEVIFLQFDMQRIAKFSLGRGWRSLNNTERDRFVDLFRQLLARSYIPTIDGYAGEKITYKREIIKGDKAEVQTVVVSSSKEIPLNYKLKLSNGRWLIYDVIIENVSLVRNYRSQFDPIMKKEGFDGLIKRMEKRIAEAGAKDSD